MNDEDSISDRPVLKFRDGRTLRADPGACIWCQQRVETGRRMSGTTDPYDPAWQVHGDFGCDRSPITDEEGVGDHARPYDLALETLRRNGDIPVHNPDPTGGVS